MGDGRGGGEAEWWVDGGVEVEVCVCVCVSFGCVRVCEVCVSEFV